MIKRCIPDTEVLEVLTHCHGSSYKGHYGASKTGAKVLESGFFWPTLFKDVREFILYCDRCQCVGNISKRHELPLTSVLEVEIFNVWGIDFVGSFPSSFVNQYILVGVDDMSKWAEALATPTNDAKVVLRFLKKIFT